MPVHVIVVLRNLMLSLLLLCTRVNIAVPVPLVSIFALVCKSYKSFILFQTPEECRITKAARRKCWVAAARLAWRVVYPVCIVWDYTCQGTVNKDSVRLLHTVLDPPAKSAHEWEHVWISYSSGAWRRISPWVTGAHRILEMQPAEWVFFFWFAFKHAGSVWFTQWSLIETWNCSQLWAHVIASGTQV